MRRNIILGTIAIIVIAIIAVLIITLTNKNDKNNVQSFGKANDITSNVSKPTVLVEIENIDKNDNNLFIPGAVIQLIDSNNKITDVVIGPDGKAQVSLEYGDYHLKEISPSKDYLASSDFVSFVLSAQDQNVKPIKFYSEKIDLNAKNLIESPDTKADDSYIFPNSNTNDVIPVQLTENTNSILDNSNDDLINFSNNLNNNNLTNTNEFKNPQTADKSVIYPILIVIFSSANIVFLCMYFYLKNPRHNI